jgi:hypothetical protein
MEASVEILQCQQMHYQMLLRLITPSGMLLAEFQSSEQH